MKLKPIFWAVPCLLAACNTVEIVEDMPERIRAQDAIEIAFAKKTLNDLQAQSIAQNREYCGYIGLNASNEWVASPPKKGRKGSCYPNDVKDDFRIIASYHTHGADSGKYDSEIPSFDDLNSDIEEGVDGYISTPGGRFWFSDARKEQVTLLCEEACLLQDPNYNPENGWDIQKRYTLDELSEF